ncbi:EAL domain-containing protein [Haematospirillum sp. H1815]|uniref:bifunctional diguanylate cyclase/phosphodiesterase n=1 Tax=Haematospirillum sp. H1815 TaxID=2723108 RepID=UPI00143B2527|nr:EAL domain-containing protein [Haematospirillum sp. H1815]NKD77514.1 EAL domain-containing protein [Haematospirillum sp. H1815]
MSLSLLLFMDTATIHGSPGLAVFGVLFLAICTMMSLHLLATRSEQAGTRRKIDTLGPVVLFSFGVLGSYTTTFLSLPTALEPGFHPLILSLGLVIGVLTAYTGMSLIDTTEANLPRSALAGGTVALGLWATFYCILESMLIIPDLEYDPVLSVSALGITALICSAAFVTFPRTHGPERTVLIAALLMIGGIVTLYAIALPSVTVLPRSRSLVYIHKLDRETMGILIAITASVIGIALYSICVLLRWLTHNNAPHSSPEQSGQKTEEEQQPTSLGGRASFESRLERAITRAHRSGRQTAVLLLRIDGPALSETNRNQTLHPCLPDALGASLTLCLRTRDSLSDFGNNRFAILAEDLVDAAEAGALAGRILDCLNDAATANSNDCDITGAIGIAVCPDDGSTAQELLNRAETAMLSITESGSQSYAFFTPEMNAGNPDMLSLPHLLRLAVRHRQFRLLLQPKYRSEDNSIVGAEALLRWNHPSRGMLAPVHFIGLAEHLGIMPEIDSWVAREACRILKRWQSMGAPFDTLDLSINARPHLFNEETYAAMLEKTLKETGINPARLLIEIAAMHREDNTQSPEDTAAALRSLGVGVALEHFGTGWSSLAYLCTVAAREVKVDRALLQNLSPGSNAEKVMQSILSLIHTLNMKAVVEGVETLGMAEHLRSLGVNALQGYAFGQPCPPNVFETTVFETTRRLKQGKPSEDNTSSPGSR